MRVNLTWNPSVYTNGSDHFVLRNACVQLTISKGRISSLVDVKLKCDTISLVIILLTH